MGTEQSAENAGGAETGQDTGDTGGITTIDVGGVFDGGQEGGKEADKEGGNDQVGQQAAESAEGKGDPWELDYKGEKVIVPEAFRKEDGTPDLAGAFRAMDDMRRKMGTGEFNDAVPEEGASYDFKLPDDLAEQGIEVANPEMMGEIESLLRECTIGQKNGQKLFEGIARITGKSVALAEQASTEAHNTFIADQIKAVEPYASKADLDAFGTAAASFLTEDFKAGKFHADPEKNKQHAMALHRGLMAMNGSGEAILAMNYLMKRVGGESAIPPMNNGGGSGSATIEEMRAEMATIQGTDEYIRGDQKAVQKVQDLGARIAKKRAEK